MLSQPWTPGISSTWSQCIIYLIYYWIQPACLSFFLPSFLSSFLPSLHSFFPSFLPSCRLHVGCSLKSWPWAQNLSWDQESDAQPTESPRYPNLIYIICFFFYVVVAAIILRIAKVKKGFLPKNNRATDQTMGGILLANSQSIKMTLQSEECSWNLCVQ